MILFFQSFVNMTDNNNLICKYKIIKLSLFECFMVLGSIIFIIMILKSRSGIVWFAFRYQCFLFVLGAIFVMKTYKFLTEKKQNSNLYFMILLTIIILNLFYSFFDVDFVRHSLLRN